MTADSEKASHRNRLFPLPLPHCIMRPSSLKSHRVRSRYKLNLAIHALASKCICALNRLYSPPPHIHIHPPTLSRPFSCQPDKSLFSCFCCATSDSPSAAQFRLLSHVIEKCKNFVLQARAAHTDCAFDTMPKAFIHTIPLVSSQLTSHSTTFPLSYSSSASIVPLIASRISLPTDLNVVPMLKALPADIASLYSEEASQDLLESSMNIMLMDISAPLHKPRIAGSRTEYVALISRLVKQNMINFTPKPEVINGIFAVEKDAESDRLIIDAQPANRRFKRPPCVALPGPSHLIQLSVPKGEHVFVGKTDLSNFYHHIGLPTWMQPFFALPPLTPKELSFLGLPTDAPFPMCATMPMGFSHAVYIAQTIHEHILYQSSLLDTRHNILNLTSPDVSHDHAVHGILIDDFFIFSLNRELAENHVHSVIKAYRNAGFVVKQNKIVMPTTAPVKVIGLEVNGLTASITLPFGTQVDLIRTTLDIMRSKTVTGIELAHLLGRWTWWLMVRRPALAILQHAYRYCQLAQRRPFTLWFSVKQELSSLLALVPLLTARLDATFHHRVASSDASQLGAGVVSAVLTPALQSTLWPLCSHRHHAYVQTQLTALERRRLNAEKYEAASSSSPYDALYSTVASSAWRTIISSPWSGEEHINTLELRAALLAIHWVLSYPSSVNTRVFLLLDSTVAFFSIWKGRSSSPALLLVLRKLSALIMASGLLILPGWLPSELNPADAPSRLV